MTPREVMQILKLDGWYVAGTEGSHVHFKHPLKQGKVTVPNHKKDLKLGTLNSIKKQAGLK